MKSSDGAWQTPEAWSIPSAGVDEEDPKRDVFPPISPVEGEQRCSRSAPWTLKNGYVVSIRGRLAYDIVAIYKRTLGNELDQNENGSDPVPVRRSSHCPARATT